MPKGWMKKHLQQRTARQEHEQDERMKAQYAFAGAAKVFERLCEQIQEDLTEFHDGGGETALQYQLQTERKFRVRKASYPSVTLDVELNATTIHYERTCVADDTVTDREVERGIVRGSLRIWANLRGDVQIYKNGSPFVDMSEVSQFLLEPAVTYIETK